MSWADCFEQAPDDVTVAEIREALAAHREASNAGEDSNDETGAASDPPEPSPTRIVADADVLAADCCLDGEARAALDLLRQHSWTTLVASDRLLAEAEAIIESVSDESLAADWRDCIEVWREPVDQPAGDHPALASAYRGGAMHLLAFGDELTGSAAGAALHNRFPVSVRQPDAFTLLFDPESLYEADLSGEYSGPDRDPRA